jgi:hypothetical protein
MVRRLQILFISISCFFSVGCTSQSLLLVDPRTGSTVKCGAMGSGILASAVGSSMEECLKYEEKGYVPVEKLAPEERVDLEQRGLLPKSDGPPPNLGY